MKSKPLFQFSTDEQATGLLTPDGKMIYAKAVEGVWHDGGSVPKTEIPLSIPDLNAVQFVLGASKRNSDGVQVTVPFAHTTDASSTQDVRIEGDKVVLRCGANYAGMEFRAYVFYTKIEAAPGLQNGW